MHAAAIEDGAYVGFFQVTSAIPEAQRELNDTGEPLLVIEDNEIVDMEYDNEGFVKGKVKFQNDSQMDVTPLQAGYKACGHLNS